MDISKNSLMQYKERVDLLIFNMFNIYYDSHHSPGFLMTENRISDIKSRANHICDIQSRAI